jgi:adenylate cyclase
VNKKTIYTDPNVRHEYEWSIPPREALYMMLRHADISKIRYVYTDIHNHIWEIDVYENKNIGVVTADVELTNIREKIILPAWIGREVTKDKKITNNALAKTPYATWTPQEQAWYQTLKKR